MFNIPHRPVRLRLAGAFLALAALSGGAMAFEPLDQPDEGPPLLLQPSDGDAADQELDGADLVSSSPASGTGEEAPADYSITVSFGAAEPVPSMPGAVASTGYGQDHGEFAMWLNNPWGSVVARADGP